MRRRKGSHKKHSRKPSKKTTYKDDHGYDREHSNLVHRHRAYWHIYKPNRKKYPLPFSAYEVHHKDGDKNNNKISNLQVVTPEEHDKLHDRMDRDFEDYDARRKGDKVKQIVLWMRKEDTKQLIKNVIILVSINILSFVIMTWAPVFLRYIFIFPIALYSIYLLVMIIYLLIKKAYQKWFLTMDKAIMKEAKKLIKHDLWDKHVENAH